jgi:ribosomal protein S18 acetylase RimI-like enzyme
MYHQLTNFKSYNGWFVDLYVRVSNAVAIGMYRKFGYSVYRRVKNYYAGAVDEDAYGKVPVASLIYEKSVTK